MSNLLLYFSTTMSNKLQTDEPSKQPNLNGQNIPEMNIVDHSNSKEYRASEQM